MDDREVTDGLEFIAENADPWLGVNVLTEFVFCPRAGIIEWEKSQNDCGEEEPPRANLSFVPRYDLRAIIREIERTSRHLLRWIPLPSILLLITVALGFFYGYWSAVSGLIVTYFLCLPVYTSLERLNVLRRLQAEALSRKASEPDPASTEEQPVDWWEMFHAGFESYAYPDALRDEELRLAGNPWRILRRGGLRIPVFKRRFVDGPNGKKLFKQHYVRMAAYCHLLEKIEQAQSPYGIILFADSYKGVTIPKATVASWAAFQSGLVNARSVLKGLRERVPDPPTQKSRCAGCPLGKPFRVRRDHNTKLRNFSLPIFKVADSRGRIYHSMCGDRFEWLPPHARAIQKELTRPETKATDPETNPEFLRPRA